MPRDANGNMTLPAGNPVVTGTAISSAVHNATIADLAAEIQDSLSRSGKGGMSAAMKFADGSEGAPSITFTNETTTGWFRSAAGVLTASILGVWRMAIEAIGVTIKGNLHFSDSANIHAPTGSAGKTIGICTNNVARLTVSDTAVTVGTLQIKGVVDPTAAQDVATKAYVDALAAPVYAAADVTVPSGGALTDVISFSALANAWYDIDCFLPVTTADSRCALSVRVATSAGANTEVLMINANYAATGAQLYFAGNTNVTHVVNNDPGSTSYGVSIRGTVKMGASDATITIQAQEVSAFAAITVTSGALLIRRRIK